MPVLEVTQLRLKGLAANDPALLHDLSAVRSKLHTKSQFYSCIEDPAVVYILGIWPTLEAHLEFLSSPARDEILGPQESILAFGWTAHMKLNGIDCLPLDAPVLALERLDVKGDCASAFEQAAARHAHFLQGSHPFKVAHGWRLDAPAGRHETLIFSGWQHTQDHVTFAEKQKGNSCSDTAAIVGGYVQIELHHAWNIEHKQE